MKLVILVGLPGSGKSTLCQEYPDYVRINQDELGDRYKCLKAFRKAAKEDKNVIVDRCNINKQQRRIWLYEAKHYKIDEIKCIVLRNNLEKCISRITKRENHPNLGQKTSIAKVREIVYNFLNSYEEPILEEGFDVIEILE